MKAEDIRGYLDLALTDTCNRYLNLIDDLGVLDQKKRSQKQEEILAARNELLDKWVPFYAEQLVTLAEKKKA